MEPCTIIILGATGDLSKRKLIPAVYRLLKDNYLDRCALVGLSLADGTAENMLEAARPFITDFDQGVWDRLRSYASYVQGDFHDIGMYARLAGTLTEVEKQHDLPGNRLLYLATMPEHFATLTKQLALHRIISRGSEAAGKGWQRVVYEKPFGHDGRSAEDINQAIRSVFDESQVYRIDHYLGKEVVSTITTLRCANMIFMPLWQREYIESVQIILNEKRGIEQRGRYYNSYGALKDMVQNHMLQLLALVAMEPPAKFEDQHIRDAKAQVLSKTNVVDVLLGQYDGYRDEAFIPKDSQTDTFAALKLSIDNDRWRGVPFYLKTGKNLYEYSASIHLKLKPVAHMADIAPGAQANSITLQIEPEEGFLLNLNTDVPGQPMQTTPITMQWSHKCVFGHNTPKSYERLLADAIRGDQSVFVRFDEIAHSWRIIDSIKSEERERHTYAQGGRGPKELEAFAETHDMEWYR